MSEVLEKITQQALGLPEEDQYDLYLKLARSLSFENVDILESYHRSKEMEQGIVQPLSEEEMVKKISDLKLNFRNGI